MPSFAEKDRWAKIRDEKRALQSYAADTDRISALTEVGKVKAARDVEMAKAKAANPLAFSSTPLLDKKMGLYDEPAAAGTPSSPGASSPGSPGAIVGAANTFGEPTTTPLGMTISTPRSGFDFLEDPLKKVDSMAGGGEIVGPPGDDQVPAEMPDGDPARLQDGEVVLPAEYVHQLGVKAIRDAVEAVTGKPMDPAMKPPLPGQGGPAVGAADGGWVSRLKNRGQVIDDAVDAAVMGGPKVAKAVPPPEPPADTGEFDREAFMRSLYGGGEVKGIKGYSRGGLVPSMASGAAELYRRRIQPKDTGEPTIWNGQPLESTGGYPLVRQGTDQARMLAEQGMNNTLTQSPGAFRDSLTLYKANGGEPVDTRQTGIPQMPSNVLPGSRERAAVQRGEAPVVGKAAPAPPGASEQARAVARAMAEQPRSEQALLDRLAPGGTQLTRKGRVFQLKDTTEARPGYSGVTYSDSIQGTALGQRTPPREDAQTMEELRGLYSKRAEGQAAQKAALGVGGVRQAMLNRPAVTEAERASDVANTRAANAQEVQMAAARAALKPSDALAERRFQYDQGEDKRKATAKLAADQQKAVNNTIKDFGVPGAMPQHEYANVLGNLLARGVPLSDAVYAATSVASDERMVDAFRNYQKKGKKVYSEDMGGEVNPMDYFNFKLEEFLKQ